MERVLEHLQTARWCLSVCLFSGRIWEMQVVAKTANIIRSNNLPACEVLRGYRHLQRRGWKVEDST
jgi:hypothetical protein